MLESYNPEKHMLRVLTRAKNGIQTWMVSYLHCSRSCRRTCPRSRPWFFKKILRASRNPNKIRFWPLWKNTVVRVEIRIKSVFYPLWHSKPSRVFTQNLFSSTQSRIGNGTSGVCYTLWTYEPGFPCNLHWIHVVVPGEKLSLPWVVGQCFKI